MCEKFLRWASGIDNLKGVFLGRLIIGLFFISYGSVAIFQDKLA